MGICWSRPPGNAIAAHFWRSLGAFGREPCCAGLQPDTDYSCSFPPPNDRRILKRGHKCPWTRRLKMRQVLQSLADGRTILAEVPASAAPRGGVLVRTTHSLISAGTER